MGGEAGIRIAWHPPAQRYPLEADTPCFQHCAGSGRRPSNGEAGKPDFWIHGGSPNNPPIHIAFAVATRALVDAFYKAALEAGGTDNGPPGLRAHYHPDYYGAFVRDPDGHNIEAVCHKAA